MLNFLIVSDTHGNEYLLRRLLDGNRTADAVFFLGDGLRELEEITVTGGYPPVFAVRGNCDSEVSLYHREREEELLLEFGGHRLLLLHGHTVSVKLTLGALLDRARAYGADVVLFGHTHDPEEGYRSEEQGGPVHYFNPGSLGRPYDGRPHFGRLTIDGSGALLFSHGVWEETQ